MKRVTRVLALLLIMVAFAVSSVMTYADSTCNVSTEAELVDALNNASQDESSPTEIVISNDIVLSSAALLPQGRFAVIRGNDKNTKITYAGKKEYKSGLNTEAEGFLTIKGSATIESLTLDACKLRRTVAVIGPNATLTLNPGAIITGGRLGEETNKGAGVYIDGKNKKRAKLILNEGSGITENTEKAAQDNKGKEYIKKVDGIGVYANSYTDIIINGGHISNNKDINKTINPNLGTYGAGVYVGVDCTLTMSSGSIENNVSHGDGGGIYSIGNVIIDGGKISKNEAASFGGGILAKNNVVFNGGSIDNNRACISPNANFSSNKPYGCGGGVLVEKNGNFEMNGGSMSGNIAETKVSDYFISCNAGQGGAVYSRGNAHINGGTIEGNKAVTVKGNNNKAGHGGGIAVEGGIDVGRVDISNASIVSNSANGLGNDIFINEVDVHENTGNGLQTTHEAGVPVIKGSANIGDLYMEKGCVLYIADSISNSNITFDITDAKVGTVVAEAIGDYVIEPADAKALKSKSGCILKLEYDKIKISEKYEEACGDISDAKIGAIQDIVYTGKAIKPEFEVTLGDKLLNRGTDYIVKYYDNVNVGTAKLKILGNGSYEGTLNGSFEIKPKSITAAKAINPRDRIYTGEEIIPDVRIYDNKVMLSEGTDYTISYENNKAIGTANIIVRGKGNYCDELQSSFQIKDESELTVVSNQEELNYAVEQAGGTANVPSNIYINGSIDLETTLKIPANKFIRLSGTGNDATITGSNYGDNLIECNGNLTLDQITIDANKKGRAVLNEKNAVLNIEWGTLIKNGKAVASKTGIGAGIYNKGTLKVFEGEIRENIAILGAGIGNEGSAEICDGIICENTASGNTANGRTPKGGAVYNASAAELKLGNVIVKDNKSNEYGGGVYNDGMVTIDNAQIKNNSTQIAGGGIFTSGTLKMNDGNISDNVVSASTIDRMYSCGGGVYVNSGNFEMKNGLIEGNSAINTYFSNQYTASVGNGGGVYVNNDKKNPGVFTMTGGSIRENIAKSKISNMTAGHGGGVFVMGGNGSDENGYAAKEGTFNMYGGVISNNRANDSGAGVYITSKEYAENNSSFTPTFKIDFSGQGKMNVGGNAKIKDNIHDNLVLQDDSSICINQVLTGEIRFTSESSSDFTLATGDGEYVPASEDANALINEHGKRKVEFSDGEIILKSINIEELYEASCLETSRVYDGKHFRPEIKIVSKSDNYNELSRSSYEIKYPANSTDAGEYYATVTGIGDYSGKIKVPYEVLPMELSKVKVKALSAKTYTGRAINYQPQYGEIYYGSLRLARGTDYKITRYSNNIKTGKATMTLTGIDNYEGSVNAYFVIKPDKGSVSKLTAGKKKVRVSIKSQKSSGVSGYQIGYKLSSSKSFKVVNTTSLSKDIKSLKKGKIYNFKVRAYKTVDGVKQYGAWSTIKSVKAK